MTLPEIPDEAVRAGAQGCKQADETWQEAGYDDEYDAMRDARQVLRPAWPHLYAAALRHAVDECVPDGAPDGDWRTALRRMADEVTA